MMLKYEYLLIGSAAAWVKEAVALRHPTQAGVKVDTYWNNRVTPLPPGIHLAVRATEGAAAVVRIQRPAHADLCLASVCELAEGREMGSALLNGAAQAGLPILQPVTTTGLQPDVRIRFYEEGYEQEELRLIFKQGLAFFALNDQQEMVFLHSEPQAVYLAIETTQNALPSKLVRALEKVNALPAITPADHGQQLVRMQPWWRHGKPLPNLPAKQQIPQLHQLEVESKLAVQAEFSQMSWRLVEWLQQGGLAGFTLYDGDASVRHTHSYIRYLKGKSKLILQGASYRFAQKDRATDRPLSLSKGPVSEPIGELVEPAVFVRFEEKPAFRSITTLETACAINQQCQQMKAIGEFYCHKRKFMLQSQVTGGGYHVLIDRSVIAGAPEQPLVQIEVECQWNKLLPSQPIADPMDVAVAEVQQITTALGQALQGVQPTQLTKRAWLKAVGQ
jgi:hypothetical protein